MKSTKERLLDFLKYKQFKKTDFYKVTGIKRGFLDSDKLKGSVSDAFVTLILRTYSEINIHWLLTGRGAMLQRAAQANTSKGFPLLEAHKIDLWDSKSSKDVLHPDILRYEILEFENLQADFMIKVPGISMYPKYNNGDVLACKKISVASFFQWNRVYVLYTTVQGTLVKRLQKGSTKNHVLCVSDNSDFKDFELALCQITAIALVVGVVHIE